MTIEMQVKIKRLEQLVAEQAAQIADLLARLEALEKRKKAA